MSRALVLFCIVVCFSYSESSPFLKAMQKCSLKDFECRKRHYDSTLNLIAKYGIPEYDIPGLDPFIVNDQGVVVGGLFNVTMKNGIAEGLKTCKLLAMDTDMYKLTTTIDMSCELVSAKGTYSMRSASLIEQVIGNVVSGDGNCHISMENLIIKLIYPFSVEKHEDGEIYLIPDTKRYTYTHEVLGNINVDIDHIDFAGYEVAPAVTSFINRNAKYLIKTVGKFFSDKALSLFDENINRFFISIPAKEYVTDDLTQYVRR